MARIKAIEAIGDKMNALKDKRVAKHIIRFKNELFRLNHIKPEEIELGQAKYDSETDTYIIELKTNISLSDIALPKGYIDVNGNIMGQESLLNKMSGKSKIRFNVQPLTISETISEPEPVVEEAVNPESPTPEAQDPEVQVVEEHEPVAEAPANQNKKSKITLEVLAQEGILNDPEFLQIIITEQQKMLDEMEKNNEQSTSKYNTCNLFTSNLERRLELMNALIANSEKIRAFLTDYYKDLANFKELDEIREKYDILIAQAQGLSYFEIDKFAYQMKDFEQAKEETDRMFRDLITDRETPSVDEFNEVVNVEYNLVKTEDQEKYFDYVQGLKKQYANIFGISIQNEPEVLVPTPGTPSGLTPPSGPTPGTPSGSTPPSGPTPGTPSGSTPPSGPTPGTPSGSTPPSGPTPGTPSGSTPPSGPTPGTPSGSTPPSGPTPGTPSGSTPPSGPTPQPISPSNTNNGVLNDYLNRLKMIEMFTIQMINLEIEVNNLENSAINNGLSDANQLKQIAILNRRIEELNQKIMEMKMQLSDIEYKEFIENNYCIINEPEVIAAKARMEQNINASKGMLFGENVEARFENKNQIMNAAMDILDTKTNGLERQMIITFIKNVHNSKCRYANNLITYVDKNGKKYDSIAILSTHNINISNLSANGPVIEPIVEVIDPETVEVLEKPVIGIDGSVIVEKSEKADKAASDGLLTPEEIERLLSGMDLLSYEIAEPTLEGPVKEDDFDLEAYKKEAIKKIESKPAMIEPNYYIEKVLNATTKYEIDGLVAAVESYQVQFEQQQASIVDNLMNTLKNEINELEEYKREAIELIQSRETSLDLEYYIDGIAKADNKYTVDVFKSAAIMLQNQYEEKNKQQEKEIKEDNNDIIVEESEKTDTIALAFAKDMAIMKIKKLTHILIDKSIEVVKGLLSVEAVEAYVRQAQAINELEAERKANLIEIKEQTVEPETVEVQVTEEETAEVGVVSFEDVEKNLGISLDENPEVTQKPIKEEPTPAKVKEVELIEEPKVMDYKIKDVQLKTSSSEPVYQISLADSIFIEGADKIKITQAGQRIRIVFTKSILEKLNAMKAKIKRIESAKGTEIRNMPGVEKEKVEGIGNKVRIHYEYNDEDHVAEIEYEEKPSGLGM